MKNPFLMADTWRLNALQQVAFDQLAAEGTIAPAPLILPKPVNPERCVNVR